MSDQPEKPSKIKEFLKQQNNIDLSKLDQSQSQQDYKEFIRRKFTEEPKQHTKISFNFRQKLQDLTKYIFFFRTKKFRQFSLETLPVLAFLSFSCYILWKMEDQLDVMRRKVIRTKTLKQLEVERENELLTRSLDDTKFTDSVQIPDYEPEYKYSLLKL